jgi:hypothetical protein
MKEPQLVMSPLCRAIVRDGQTVRVEIYRLESSGWTLEVVDAHGNPTVWDDEFETDQGALDEVNRTILDEGINALIGSVSSVAS